MVMECVNTSTGELYDGRTINKPCGTRLAERCLHCSQVYAADARSVFNGGVESDDELASHFTFVTLTAPGADVFGRSHQRVTRSVAGKGRGGKRRKSPKKIVVIRCGCGHRHRQDDAILGTPIDPSTYRYDLAADFNASSSRLLSITLQRLSRAMYPKKGASDSGERQSLKYARVAEFQKRGLIHFHILIRDAVPAGMLETIVRGGKDEANNVVIPAVRHGVWEWGKQVDVKVIDSKDRDKVGYYLRKLISYSTKSTDSAASGTVEHRGKMQSAALRGCSCEAGRHCARGRRGEAKTNTYHTKMADKFCRRHQLAYNGWGFRGHVLAISRTWGMTFKEVRKRRSDFVKKSIPEPVGYVVWGWRILPAVLLSPLRV